MDININRTSYKSEKKVKKSKVKKGESDKVKKVKNTIKPIKLHKVNFFWNPINKNTPKTVSAITTNSEKAKA